MATQTRSRRKPFNRPVVPDRLDLRDRLYLPAVATAPPSRLRSVGTIPLPVLNQGRTNACTGFALANVVNFLLMRAGRRNETPVSPFMVYSMARRYDEFPGAAADTGSSLRGAMKGWYKHGVCNHKLWQTEKMPPPQADPTKDWWQEAARRPLGAYYRVDTRSVTDMHTALNEAGVLYASAICHGGWDEGLSLPAGARKGWRIPLRKAGPDDGGHAFVIVGYGEHGFLILNSWGKQWGDRGFATLAYEDWLEHAMDCWVAQLGVATDLHRELTQAPSLRTTSEGKVSLAADAVLRNREIAPFIINMENNGALSRSGDFRTQESDLRALVTHHRAVARSAWRIQSGPMDVAIYAHGGLTGEDGAARTAARWIPALYEARIFPVFLMWETDLWSTLKSRLEDLVSGHPPGGYPRPTGGLREQFARFWNERLERTLAGPGSLIWDEMKQNARAITVNQESGARILFRIGQNLKVFSPNRARLHLIGHSAGSIVHSYLIDALVRGEWRFKTVNFLAPAVTAGTFRKTVLPHINSKKVEKYNQFHLKDEVEEKDPTCRPILGYGRSLLYLVSESFEHGRRTSILGMEKFFAGAVAGAPTGNVQSWTAPADVSRTTTHGGFEDDPRTVESVIRLIKSGGPA